MIAGLVVKSRDYDKRDFYYQLISEESLYRRLIASGWPPAHGRACAMSADDKMKPPSPQVSVVSLAIELTSTFRILRASQRQRRVKRIACSRARGWSRAYALALISR